MHLYTPLPSSNAEKSKLMQPFILLCFSSVLYTLYRVVYICRDLCRRCHSFPPIYLYFNCY